MVLIMSGILHSVFCNCFTNPMVHDNEEEVINNAWTHVPTIPSKRPVDNNSENPAATSQQQQGGVAGAPNQENMDDGDIQPLSDDVDQTNNVFSVPWKTSKDSVDLNSIPEVGFIVSKPNEVDQSEIHAYSWNNVNKGDKIWGGEDGVPVELEDKRPNIKESLPLPWEGKSKPVPYTKTTTGPSWEQAQAQAANGN